MTMKKVFLVLMICLPSLLSYSQTKEETIKELFHLMQQDSLVDKMFGSMIPTMMNQMKSQFPIKDSLATAHSNEMMKSTMQTVKEISKKMINEDMVALYDKYFSQNEINDFIAFYKSPSGQKFIKVTPDIQKEMMIIMMQKYMPEIHKTINAQTEEMKKTDKK
jgi:hypothetical protein